MPDAFGPQDLARLLGVPRETLERLETHRRLLALWSKKINLIGPAEIDQYWRRHALDSAQLATLAPGDASRWIDLGAGAGFPGLVVACVMAGRPGAQVDLVEINAKKAAFLREAIRETGAPATVLEMDVVEAAARPVRYDVLTARAFAPLPRIISSAKAILDRGAVGLLLKGEAVPEELAAVAQEGWRLQVEVLNSLSDKSGRILRIEGADRVGSTE